MDSQIGTATGRVLPNGKQHHPNGLKSTCAMQSSVLTTKRRINNFQKDCKVKLSPNHQKRSIFQSWSYNPENTKGLWIGDGETGLNIKLQKLGYVCLRWKEYHLALYST